jgi:radical SAM superfamily enzyme YgiQ (UPF0313 family)
VSEKPRNILLATLNNAQMCVGLLQLGTYLARQGHNVRVMGDTSVSKLLEREDFDQTVRHSNPDLLGISALTPNADHIGTFCARVEAALGRRPFTVAGGVHATLLPQTVLEQNPLVDCAIVGEGEIPLVALAECAGGELSAIPSLAWRRDGKIVINDRCDTLPIEQTLQCDESLLDEASFRVYDETPNFIPAGKHRRHPRHPARIGGSGPGQAP